MVWSPTAPRHTRRDFKAGTMECSSKYLSHILLFVRISSQTRTSKRRKTMAVYMQIERPYFSCREPHIETLSKTLLSNIPTSAHRSFGGWEPPSKYSESHPSTFSVINGAGASVNSSAAPNGKGPETTLPPRSLLLWR